MAKRYVEFNLVPEGNFKPEGTLGHHHCTVIRQGDEKIVVGSVSGRVTLKQGDTLGYNFGTVWLVPNADSYRDPIRRVLAQAHVSQKLLEYSLDPVEYTDSWQDTSGWPDNSAADPSTGEEAAVFGTKTTEALDRHERERNYRVTGGDAIVIRQAIGRDTTFYRTRRVSRVVVRPTADKAAVAKWLFEEVVPEGRDRRIERENKKQFLASVKELLVSQGMKVSSDDELLSIGNLYKVVSEARHRCKEMWFEGVQYRLSWYCNTKGVDQLFFELVGKWCQEREQTQVNFVTALHSGLLQAWVEASKVVD